VDEIEFGLETTENQALSVPMQNVDKIVEPSSPQSSKTDGSRRGRIALLVNGLGATLRWNSKSGERGFCQFRARNIEVAGLVGHLSFSSSI
jgi:hypothetical protein